MQQVPEFKKNLWGYDCDTVQNYLEDVQKSEKEWQEKIASITHSREELQEQIKAFQGQLQDSEDTLNGEKGKNKKLSQMIRMLQEEIDHQRRLLDSQTKEYRRVQEENTALERQVKQATDKEKRYYEATASIGSAILRAQQTADNMIDSAKGEVTAIRGRANGMADDILENMKAMYREFSDFRSNVNAVVNQMNARFDEIESEMLRTGEMILNFKKDLPKEKEVIAEQEAVSEDTKAEE